MNVVINANAPDSLPPSGNPLVHHGNFYHHLLNCLGFPEEKPPVAALLRQVMHFPPEGHWLIASPVHWQVTHNDAFIEATGDSLGLSEEEGRAFFEVFAQYFREEDTFCLQYCNASTWFLQYGDKPAIRARPVAAMLHRSIMPELAALDTTLYWQRVFTESQMLLNSTPLNGARHPFPIINGVWFWGDGTLPLAGQKPMIADAASFPIANALSSAASLYDVGMNPKRLAKDTTLLFQRVSEETLSGLQHHLKKHTVRWYWNNRAYVSHQQRWFSPFSRHFTP